MQNAELTQHLVLLEERAAQLEAHMAAIEPLLRHIKSALPIPSALSLVAQRLLAIDTKLALLVPPSDVRQAIADATEHHEATAEAAPQLAQQLNEITEWIESRMSGDQLQLEFGDLAFVSKQLVSVMQGTRADIVQMRATLLRLANAVEVAIGQMPSGARSVNTPPQIEERTPPADG